MQHVSRSASLCLVCGGEGIEPEDGITCPACRGTGRRLRNTYRRPRRIERLVAMMITLAIMAVASILWAWLGAGTADAQERPTVESRTLSSDAVPSYLSAKQRADRGLPARIVALPPSVTVQPAPAVLSDNIPAGTVSAKPGPQIDAERAKPETLASFLDRPEVLRLLGQTESGQWIANYCHSICPGAPDDVVHLVAEEWVRWRILYPDHPSVTQKRRWLQTIRNECMFNPPDITPPFSASGLLQFLPSTCDWFGADLSRLQTTRGHTEEDLRRYLADVRYQYRKGCELLGNKEGGYWSQWSGAPGRCD